nr:hypothetical protein [Mesorhizobium sp.]
MQSYELPLDGIRLLISSRMLVARAMRLLEGISEAVDVFLVSFLDYCPRVAIVHVVTSTSVPEYVRSRHLEIWFTENVTQSIDLVRNLLKFEYVIASVLVLYAQESALRYPVAIGRFIRPLIGAEPANEVIEGHEWAKAPVTCDSVRPATSPVQSCNLIPITAVDPVPGIANDCHHAKFSSDRVLVQERLE